MVAICGPQSSAREELGPQFETTFDRKTADFVLALGTFYCRHLQAPIMATIEREGVVYANVYDLRGGADAEIAHSAAVVKLTNARIAQYSSRALRKNGPGCNERSPMRLTGITFEALPVEKISSAFSKSA